MISRLSHHRGAGATTNPSRGEAPAAQRRQQQRGIVLLEMAMVSMFLLLVAAGTFDYGQGWRSGLAVNEAVRTAARTASQAQNDRSADYSALSAAKASLTASGKLAKVQRVVVFNAGSANGTIPTACKTGSTSACETITGAAFRTNWDSLGTTGATTSRGCLLVATAQNFCPTSRSNVQLTADYVGIWIQYQHDYLFPIVGSSTTIERTAVMRVEPQED